MASKMTAIFYLDKKKRVRWKILAGNFRNVGNGGEGYNSFRAAWKMFCKIVGDPTRYNIDTRKAMIEMKPKNGYRRFRMA